MARKSFFRRTYLSSVMLVLFAFLMVGSSFFYQLDRYALSEKERQLRATADSIAELTSCAVLDESDLSIVLLDVSLRNTASEDQMTILLANATGDLLLRIEPDEQVYKKSGRLPENAVRALKREGAYSEIGMLGGVFDSAHYIVGAPCRSSDGETVALVFVASSNEKVVGVLQKVSQTFLVILALSLIGALMVSYVMASRVTRPLKTMANATREYAAGNFSVRVPEDNQCEELDELATSFNNMARDLEQLEELTQGFIGNVSHEFKTPMTTISGFVDGMLDGTIPPEETKHYLGIVSQETGRLARLVQNMLDITKLEAGEVPIHAQTYDLWKTVTDVVLSDEQRIEDGKIDIQGLGGDPLLIYADPDFVHQVVYNIVDNAIKFTPAGGTISFAAERRGNMVEVRIENTGAGIAPEALPFVFERFYKEDRSRGMNTRGSGLGLHICKILVNLSGGQIHAESEEGNWCRFVFTLPAGQ